MATFKLSSHATNQYWCAILYNNVWGACNYFCPPDNNNDDDGSVFASPMPPAIADDQGTLEQAAHEAFCQDRVCQLYAMQPSEWFKKLFISYSSDTLSKLDLTQDSFNILGYLAFHYGFIPPLPLQPGPPVDPKEWEENIKNVGLDISKNPPSADLAMPILTFLQGLQSAAGPSLELWDLRPGNCRHVDSHYSSQIISKQNDDLFFLCPPSLTDEPHCPWTIATAADALFVYGLLIEKDFSAILLGYVLIDEGIRFCTLQPLSSASIPST
ncbi:hypothetical protein BYT27DRAFT_7256943 [Phlegmacium glaucopus]|nr:hypothetical protein BYT27DRAFT_7256943 [Phlegmacium glaucopus]